MTEKNLGKNIAYYRKEKGLSQEKVAEYMEVSRQAVTKWESGLSRPSTDNLIKLAGLLEVNVEVLLGSDVQSEATEKPDITVGRASAIFIAISFLMIIIYIVAGICNNTLSAGTLICVFVMAVPTQLFLHLYFANAIKSNSFTGIARFNAKLEYLGLCLRWQLTYLYYNKERKKQYFFANFIKDKKTTCIHKWSDV